MIKIRDLLDDVLLLLGGLLVATLASLVFIACSSETKYVLVDDKEAYMAQAALDEYKVTFLFEVDNVRVYRFRDNGSYKYFATGDGRVISAPTSKYDPATKRYEDVESTVAQ